MVNFCPKCGEHIEIDAKFCDNCGFDLKERKEKEKAELKKFKKSKKPKKTKKTKATVSETYGEYSGIGRRFLAFIIDWIIVLIINGIFYPEVKFFDIKWRPFKFTWVNQALWNLSLLTSWLIGFLYFWIMESYNNGRSVGKLICGIKTVDKKSLEVTTPGRNAVNNILKTTTILFVLDFIIGIIANYGKPEKRLRIGQNWSKTVVIRVR
jgi:uncharacterized RDD family membrane protein YckC